MLLPAPRPLPLLLLLTLALLAATAPPAGLGQSPPAPIDAAARRDVIDTVAAELARFYVDADTGRLIGRHLQERLAVGAYDRATNRAEFAAAVTADLRSVNGDRHLSLAYDVGFPVDRPDPHGLTTPRPSKPGQPAPDEPQPTPAMLADWRRSNFGLARADRLDGNIGYIEVHGFYDGPEAVAAARAALDFLERTDAMIFDLRDMPGGSGDMSNWLLSHFTGPDTVAALAITNRSAGDSVVRWTLANVPGTRRPDVPLFILTSPGTASAGEDFTFVLHNLGRATLVGETTAGAGHNNAFLDAGHGFVVSVSYTRVMDPRSGREWERVGVHPDVAVPADRALDTARVLALEAIAVRTDNPNRKRGLRLSMQTLEARLHPHRVPAALLARYAGTYGERSLRLRGDSLVFRRGAHAAQPLVPLDDSTFALADVERITIEGARRGRPRLRLVRENGDTLRSERTGPPPRDP